MLGSPFLYIPSANSAFYFDTKRESRVEVFKVLGVLCK